MNYRITTVLLAVTLLLVLGVPAIQAAPLGQPEASANTVAAAGDYDFTTHGTAWVRQVPGEFILFRPLGWGIEARAKAAGSKWVHIPVPFPSRIANSLMKIKFVEFCAQSTNGAISKPTRMDLWDYNGRFGSVNISWPADNAKHCYTYTFGSPAFHQDLGVSVLLYFANTTDKITLYKAWVRIVP